MIVIHTAMLREFRLAPSAVVRVEPGATRRAAAVAAHLGFLCELLHHHHQGEDDLLWPPLRERLSDPAMAFLDQAERQHVGIDAALRELAGARARWVHDPNLAHRASLVVELENLYELLKIHLELEERSLLPLAASLLSAAEWQAIGDAGAASLPRRTLILAFGMFAYEADPVVVRAMLASAPALPRFLISRVAPHAYARRALLVHGTSRP